MKRTATNIEQAVDLAIRQPGHVIRVRRTWAARFEPELGRVSAYHHGTRVLSAHVAEGLTATLPTELGQDAWGSVSDQQGVNRVLRHLGISLWASRADGDFRLLPTPSAGRNPAYS